MTRRKFAIFALLVSLVLCGLAAAQTPSQTQYGPPTGAGPPGAPPGQLPPGQQPPGAPPGQQPPGGPPGGQPPGGAPPEEGPGVPFVDGLPFTGFQATLLLLAGIAAASAGVALRRSAPGKSAQRQGEPGLTAVTAILRPEEGREDSHLERCPICGTEYDPRGYRVAVGGVGSFDKVECAMRAHERRLGSPAYALYA